MRKRLADWLDERAGWRADLHAALHEPVPGGARWAYVFGSALVVLLVLQTVTGILLATVYSPSSTQAWGSVAYIQDRMTLGWLVRGLHHAGASALVIVVVLHLTQVLLYGAYRAPRELNWWTGLLLLGLVLAFALTGYLLPWDQKGYWATQVATSIAGTVPLAGRFLERMAVGGSEYGNLTLTRFYAAHVLVLPAPTLLLVVYHVRLFRRHGVTPRWGRNPDELRARTAPFWPDQLARDAAFALLVVAIMLAVVWRSHGAPLDAPADPSSSYVARPEWYFLFLFELLKFFEGRAEMVGTVVLPALASIYLVILPLIDRGPDRSPRRRLPSVLPFALGLLAVTGLTLAAHRADARDPLLAKARRTDEALAKQARMLALLGIPPAGGTAVYDNDPLHHARQLFADRCAGCHKLDGGNGDKGPDLTGWNSRAYLVAFLKDPVAPRFFGETKHFQILTHGMKPVEASPADLRALAEYVVSLGGPENGPVDTTLAARGAQIFSAKQCDLCHETDGTTAADPEGPPNHGGRGSHPWLVRFLSHPGDPLFYGDRNEMPAFAGKLSPADLDALARLIEAQEASNPDR